MKQYGIHGKTMIATENQIFMFLSDPLQFGYFFPFLRRSGLISQLFSAVSKEGSPMNSDNKTGNAKAANAGGVSSNAPELKTSAPPLAAGMQAEVRATLPGTPQPEIQEPLAQPHPLTAAIRVRWSNFSDADLKDIVTPEDLSSAVKAKYGITTDQASAQVKEWAVG